MRGKRNSDHFNLNEVLKLNNYFLGRRIPIALPNTGALARKRNSFYLRAILVICLVLFAVLQLHLINSRKYHNQIYYNNQIFPFFYFIITKTF